MADPRGESVERCHCGVVVEPRDPDPWEGRLDGYCYRCALARCDAFSDECPGDLPSLVRPAPRTQDQRSLTAQLFAVYDLAVGNGLYHAADWLQRHLESAIAATNDGRESGQ